MKGGLLSLWLLLLALLAVFDLAINIREWGGRCHVRFWECMRIGDPNTPACQLREACPEVFWNGGRRFTRAELGLPPVP